MPVKYYSVAHPGCLSHLRIFPSWIQGQKIPGFRIRIRIKEFKYFNPTNCFQALGNMIQNIHPGSGFCIFTHPRSGNQKGKGARIRIRNTDILKFQIHLFATTKYAKIKGDRPVGISHIGSMKTKMAELKRNGGSQYCGCGMVKALYEKDRNRYSMGHSEHTYPLRYFGQNKKKNKKLSGFRQGEIICISRKGKKITKKFVLYFKLKLF
jgi:hypothetical protein